MWSEHVYDLKPIKGIFGEEMPPLIGQLHEVVLHKDGPSLKLRMDLKDFPKELPKKWVEKNFNTAQITLGVGAVSAISIEGWTKDTRVEIKIEKVGDSLSLKIESAEINISCTAKTLTILELTGYRKR